MTKCASRISRSILILLFVNLLAASCGSDSSMNPLQKPQDQPRNEDPPTPTPTNPNHDTIFGTWDGSGVEGDVQYKNIVKIKADSIHITKSCTFSDGSSLGISAEGRTFAEESKKTVTLVGALFMNVGVGNHYCTIDFPKSLKFELRENFIFISLQEAEKKTGLRKISND